jgi:hypothetical protein
MSDIQAAFEKAFPVPANVFWHLESYEYERIGWEHEAQVYQAKYEGYLAGITEGERMMRERVALGCNVCADVIRKLPITGE